jgi:hypothetical protein
MDRFNREYLGTWFSWDTARRLLGNAMLAGSVLTCAAGAALAIHGGSMPPAAETVAPGPDQGTAFLHTQPNGPGYEASGLEALYFGIGSLGLGVVVRRGGLI